MIGWLRDVLARLAPQVAKAPEQEVRSVELARRADRALADLRAVRRIEIIVRRR